VLKQWLVFLHALKTMTMTPPSPVALFVCRSLMSGKGKVHG
jgi:hypothetical protein